MDAQAADEPTAEDVEVVQKQINLGAMWQPAPVNFHFVGMTMEDGMNVVTVIFETAVGTIAIPFSPEGLGELGRQASEWADKARLMVAPGSALQQKIADLNLKPGPARMRS